MTNCEVERVLNKRYLMCMISRGYEPNCHFCGEPFKVGDEIVIKRGSSRYGHKAKRYHKSCWRKMHY